jgi:hypothetical protein
MLKLKNIKLNNGIISAEYEPENTGEVGKIAVDVVSGEVVEQHLAETDNTFPMYFNKALEWLQKVRTSSEIPKEKTIMWY